MTGFSAARSEQRCKTSLRIFALLASVSLLLGPSEIYATGGGGDVSECNEQISALISASLEAPVSGSRWQVFVTRIRLLAPLAVAKTALLTGHTDLAVASLNYYVVVVQALIDRDILQLGSPPDPDLLGMAAAAISCITGDPGGNQPPVANAGADAAVLVGQTVMLDGGGSQDPDGDILTFAWTFIDLPVDSLATLDDPTSQTPSFTVDKAGTYRVQLVVNDGEFDSTPDTVDITTDNSPPVADAGPDQTAPVNDTITLDATGSTDVDGDFLIYQWSLTAVPPGSTAVLSDTTALMPTFVIDLSGSYVAELIVNDGEFDSAPDTVEINTLNSAPVADAGMDQTVLMGNLVQLDGSGSFDVDLDPLTYRWTLTDIPVGSAALLSNEFIANPTFMVDQPGMYTASLIVNDGLRDSDADVVLIATDNSAPVANAGQDIDAFVGDTVMLDGSGSFDVDNDPLTFRWSLLTVAPGSLAQLDGANTNSPDFVADAEGLYVAQLIVNDGQLDSVPDTTTITVEVPPNTDPVANDDAATTDEDTFVDIDVLGNDTDADGDTLSIFSVTAAGNGIIGGSGGGLRYTPNADFNGTDSFTYTIDDGNGGMDSATVTITINPVNDNPVANEDSATTDEDTAVTIDLLINDTDVDGDTLSVDSVTQSANGTVVNNGADVTYTPDTNFTGGDSFSYTVSDGNGGTDSAIVTVTVNPINDAPTAVDDTAATLEDTLVTIDVLFNDSDIDGDGLSVASVTQGSNGSVFNNGGNVTYTPLPNFFGVDTFTYVATDGGLNAGATVTVTVDPVNDVPVANAGAPQTVTLGQLVTLDGSSSSDIENDPLTFAWQFTQAPVGSGATLDDATAVGPTLTPDLAGIYVLQLIVNDGMAPSVPSSVTITVNASGPTTITLTPVNPQLDTRDSVSLTVTLDQPALPGGQVIDLLSSDPVVTVPLQVTVPEGSTVTSFAATTDLGVGTSTITASAAGLTSDTSLAQVSIRPFTLSIPLVGIDRTVFATLSIPRPAPAGGAVFELSVLDSGVATVSPATLTIPEGQSSAQFTLDGGSSIGATDLTVDGSSNGYESQTVEITVTDRLIDLPTQTELALGFTADLPVIIGPDPASVGGLEITVESSNPSVVQVLTPTVTIPEGDFNAIVTIQASTGQPGVANVTASNPSFAPDFTIVTVSSGLDIIEQSQSIEPGDIEPIYFRLDSGGAPFPAPAGGVVVNLSSDDSDCVMASTPATIAEGEIYGTADVTYGGVAVLPCTATVTANNPLFGTDSTVITVETVADTGTIAISSGAADNRLGSSLQTRGQITLSRTDHGGVTVEVESSDLATLGLATSADGFGAPVVEVFIPDGSTTAFVWFQGVTLATGTVQVTASQAQFSDGTVSVDVIQPVFDISGLGTSITSLAANDSFNVFTYTPNIAGTAVRQFQQVSAANGPLTVTLTSNAPAIGQLVGTTTGASVQIELQLGGNQTNVPVPEFDPLAAGSTTITASAPGFDDTFPTGSETVTVTSPGITLTSGAADNRLGSSLQTRGQITLGGANHGGVTVRVTSGNANVLRLATDAVTPGTSIVEVFIPDGTTTAFVSFQGVTLATGTVQVTASQAQFSDSTVTVDVIQPVFDISGLRTSTTSVAANDSFNVFTYTPNIAGTAVRQFQQVSAANGPLTVTLTSNAPAIGQLVGTTTGASVQIELQLGGNQTNVPVPEFDPLAAGSTTITASAPGFDDTFPTGSETVTVNP